MKILDGDTRLLRSGKARTDESLIGYIIRLTEQNGYPSPTWIISRAHLASQITRSCSFVFSGPDYFRFLSSLTGVTISELALTAYHNHLFSGLPTPPASMRLCYPKICPDCLSESPYCRRTWDLSAVTTCPKHKCLLMDECPNCKKHITWVRNRVCVCPCEFDWRESTATSVEVLETALTCRVYYLCGLPSNESIINYQSPVTNLELHDFLLVLFFFAGLYQGMSVSTGKHLLTGRNNRDIHTLLTNTHTIFDNWPKNFYQFLRWRLEQERKVPLIRNRLKSTLYLDFGKFYTGLYRVLTDRQFDFIRDAFIDYLVEEWDGGHLPSNHKKGMKQHLTGKYVFKSDARRLLSADEQRITSLVEAGRLRTVVRSKGMKRLVFIDVADIAKLIL